MRSADSWVHKAGLSLERRRERIVSIRRADSWLPKGRTWSLIRRSRRSFNPPRGFLASQRAVIHGGPRLSRRVSIRRADSWLPKGGYRQEGTEVMIEFQSAARILGFPKITGALELIKGIMFQ